ncbi:MAG: DNA polymerase I [Flavobacteriaceae bacterium]|nr:DNA polymerase I [Flavobacteriaceae bacterium]
MLTFTEEMNNRKNLYLLDAYALIFRGYYAFINRPLRNREIETSAIYGFVNSLLDLLNKEKPEHIAVCFDKGGSEERLELYPEYKSNRPKTPEGILVAVPYILKILDAIGIQVIEKSGFEADDIIGTLAKKAEQNGYKTYMVTSDKDYAQLVSEHTVMFKPARSGGEHEIWDVAKVREKFGVEFPKQVIDYLGMMGDSVDNIPGLPGIGPKTASKFIQAFGSMENLFKNLDKLKGKQRQNVENNQEIGLLSKKLATINLEVPIEFTPEKYKIGSPDTEKLKELFEELEFRNQFQRFQKIYGALSDPEASQNKVKQGDQKYQPGMIDLLFDGDQPQKESSGQIYQTVNTIMGMEILNRLLLKQKQVALRLLTDRTDPMLSLPVGLGICFADSVAYYLSLDRDKMGETLEIFRSFLESNDRLIITCDAKTMIKVFRNQDIEIQGPFFDVQLAHYLINASASHDLGIMAKQELQFDLTDLEETNSKGKRKLNVWSIDIVKKTQDVGFQADAIWQLKVLFEQKLKDTESRSVFQDIETPLLEILADMEFQGIKINPLLMKEIALGLKKDQTIREERITQAAGKKFNIGSPKELGKVLFEELKIADNPKMTKTKQYATNEAELIRYRSKHPIIETILEWRSARVLLNTFVDKLPTQINPNTSRIHTVFEQTRTASGRLSSKNPNLQNIPIRNEKGREIRKGFVPRDENHVLLAADYSQIELRVIAALSDDESMMEAFLKGQDIHQSTASKVFGIPLDQVSREQRSKAKAVNFGIVYGSSAQGLSRSAGIEISEAKKIIDSYFKTYPNLKVYMDETVNKTRQKKYTQTISGRRRPIEGITSSNSIVSRAAERQAINTPIQGSAADIIKIAMVQVNKAIKAGSFKTKLILQVHDELVFEVPKEELVHVQPIIKTCMETAYELKTPLVVDLGYGDNWLEAH